MTAEDAPPIDDQPSLASPGAADGNAAERARAIDQARRDIAEVPAVEVITTACIHLASAAAVKCGLGAGDEATVASERDLDEARKLITALAGLVTASAPDLGTFHAGPLRDALRSLQLAFRELSEYPDEPGHGPGERFTGPVVSA
jgi:hypothetical protein